MSREENVAIFEDTRAICKSNTIIANAIKLSNDHQEVFLEGDPVWPEPKAKAESAQVIVTRDGASRLRGTTLGMRPAC